MKHCRECGTPLRGHEDAVRTRLQAFAEACPEVVEALETALNQWLWYARFTHGRDLAVENHPGAKLYRECRDLLRRMTAPAAEER